MKSLDKAIEVQTEFAKSAYETFVAESQKIAGLYTDLAKQTFKPVEGLVAKFTPAAALIATRLPEFKKPGRHGRAFFVWRFEDCVCDLLRATRSFDSEVLIVSKVDRIWLAEVMSRTFGAARAIFQHGRVGSPAVLT